MNKDEVVAGVNYEIKTSNVKKAEQILIDNGIELDELALFCKLLDMH